MNRMILTAMAAVLGIATSFAQQRTYSVSDPVRLYESAAPGSETWVQNNEIERPFGTETLVMNVAVPTITPYLPAPSKATGSAMIVCPGGGYFMLSIDSEGHNVAKWLAEHGIAAFVLKYRLRYAGDTPEAVDQSVGAMFGGVTGQRQLDKAQPQGGGMPMFAAPQEGPTIQELAGDDGRAAIAYVRAHAAEYGIDPDRIGIMGFSAGSGVTYNVMYQHDERSNPNFAAPIYGGYAAEALPDNATPLFILAPEFDMWPAPTAMDIYQLWHRNHLPAELHYFSGTQHGFGLKDDGEPVNIWIKLLYNFMIKCGFVEGCDYLQ